MRYVISYDLQVPGQNYANILRLLKELGAEPILLSQYVLRRENTSARELLDRFRSAIDANDRILIICLDSTEVAEHGLIGGRDLDSI